MAAASRQLYDKYAGSAGPSPITVPGKGSRAKKQKKFFVHEGMTKAREHAL